MAHRYIMCNLENISAIDCDTLSAISNSNIGITTGKVYDDSPVTGSCAAGYEATGGGTSISLTCNSDGTWPTMACTGN